MFQNLGAVLDQFAVHVSSIAPSTEHGFSGARIWRVESDLGPLALKRWPPNTTAERLAEIHRVMAGCQYSLVPAVIPLRSGETALRRDAVYDLTSWMPGTADLQENPTAERVAAAFRAVGDLHERLCRYAPDIPPGPVVSVKRYLDVISHWRPTEPPVGLWPEQIERLKQVLIPAIPSVTESLRRLLDRPAPQQWCHGDLWYAHILMLGDGPSGVIDFGSTRIDNPATDLARLLCATPNAVDFVESAWKGYAAAQKVMPEDRSLVTDLAKANVCASAIKWIAGLSWFKTKPIGMDDRINEIVDGLADSFVGRIAEFESQ